MKQVVSQKGVRWRTPDHVRAQVLAAIAQEAAKQARSRAVESAGTACLGFVRQWLFVPSLAALAASLFLVLGPMPIRTSIQEEVVAGHVRSLLADHLTDVATSDQHTVKPWFNGKIDFSPPVVDLAPQGFPLVGGRVDYIGGRVVAALVYKRQSAISSTCSSGRRRRPRRAADIASRDGYNIENWSKGGLTFWAVSDVTADDLSRFREAFSSRTAE